MRQPGNRPVLGLLSIAIVLWPLAAYADWRDDLASEIRVAYRCEVKELVKVVERDAGGVRIVAATVHCVDGRRFTAGKIADQPFIFEPCDAPGTRACP